MIKKSYYFIFFLVLLSLIPIITGDSIQQNNIVSVDSDKTFLIGTILNPIESNMTINASALSLVYYNQGLNYEKIGIVQGFRKISFQKQPFFYVYKPGPIGLIAYVFGFCTNFEIL